MFQERCAAFLQGVQDLAYCVGFWVSFLYQQREHEGIWGVSSSCSGLDLIEGCEDYWLASVGFRNQALAKLFCCPKP